MTLRPSPALGARFSGRTSRAGELLDLVRGGDVTTIAGLSATMGIARSTVTERVDLLTDLGLLTVRGETSRGRGRPATVLSFDPSAGVVLSAQVGMSGVRVGVSDLAGSLVLARDADLDLADGPRALLDVLRREFGRLLEEGAVRQPRVLGVGVGLPGRVELETTDAAPGAPGAWAALDLRRRLEEIYGVPVVVGRGVSMLASAEHRASHGSAEVLLGVKVGTVIECGIVVSGRIVAGGDGIAGEIGHTPVAGHDVLCVCGNHGCLNAVAGGGALVSRLAGRGVPVTSARDVARLARGGDAQVAQEVREAGRHVGAVLAGAVNLLNPDIIVAWGYLVDAGEHLLAGLRETLHRTGVPAATRHVRIERASLGDDAAIQGAATTVVEEVLSPARVDAYVRGLVDGQASA